MARQLVGVMMMIIVMVVTAIGIFMVMVMVMVMILVRYIMMVMGRLMAIEITLSTPKSPK